LQKTIADATTSLENFRVNDAVQAAYHYFWHEFCDWYLELIKPRISGEASSAEKSTALSIAVHVLKTCMNLMHPYIPFISEEIWRRLKTKDEESLVVAPWPQIEKDLEDEGAEVEMQFVQQVISGVRNIRSEMNVPPSKIADLKFKTADNSKTEIIEKNKPYIRKLARVENIEHISQDEQVQQAAVSVMPDMELLVPLEKLIDLEVEKNRLNKEIQRLENQINGLNKKLANQNFLEKAPENVIKQEREKLTNFSDKLEKLKYNLAQLK
jgi:valyl-tRNA synthetase